MFTGIIEEQGVVKAVERGGRSAKMSFFCKTILEDLSIGDSLNVNGVCLTAISQIEGEFQVDISVETLKRTNLGELKVGDAVNLERALRFSSRLGGHWVTGHIDGVGMIRNRHQDENAVLFSIEIPSEIYRYSVKKGSIAVDGISLTVNDIRSNLLEVAVIPHTTSTTTLGLKGVGSSVNLEVDLIAKYVERLLSKEPSEPASRITAEFLKRKGMV